jgi:hypothetical protein
MNSAIIILITKSIYNGSYEITEGITALLKNIYNWGGAIQKRLFCRAEFFQNSKK